MQSAHNENKPQTHLRELLLQCCEHTLSSRHLFAQRQDLVALSNLQVQDALRVSVIHGVTTCQVKMETKVCTVSKTE